MYRLEVLVEGHKDSTLRLIPLKCKMVRPREVLELYNWFGGCERVGDERWPSMLRRTWDIPFNGFSLATAPARLKFVAGVTLA